MLAEATSPESWCWSVRRWKCGADSRAVILLQPPRRDSGGGPHVENFFGLGSILAPNRRWNVYNSGRQPEGP